VQDFRELVVWQRAHQLTLQIYRATRDFPREELYGITSQLRRAAASIGANIVEGRCRGSDAEFARFLNIALGSAAETEYHLLLAHDLELLAEQPHGLLNEAVVAVKRMLTTLILKLKADG
jgi:four helix bundle protein